MLDKFKKWWKDLSIRGIHAPFVHDARTGKPSVTLLFAYITFILAVASTIALHFSVKLVVATGTSIMFWVVAVIIYRIRNLDKAKIDLDDKSIELSGKGDE